MPESPRWLMGEGRADETRQVVRQMLGPAPGRPGVFPATGRNMLSPATGRLIAGLVTGTADESLAARSGPQRAARRNHGPCLESDTGEGLHGALGAGSGRSGGGDGGRECQDAAGERAADHGASAYGLVHCGAPDGFGGDRLRPYGRGAGLVAECQASSPRRI
ncbi:hypothetical protein OHA19_02490 [Streptomyces sp. NBC_00012]|uniref:hypothetical protein n=1 Tax=unclassified Streptomyces TaxID=2593676 RepID=UPI003243521D